MCVCVYESLDCVLGWIVLFYSERVESEQEVLCVV